MDNKYGYVYKTVNNLNDMVYVGQSKRWELMDSYYGSGDYFTQAFKEYGKENFTKTVLHEAETREELDYYELLEIAKMRLAHEESYNGHLGGPRATTIIIENILKKADVNVKDINSLKGMEDYYNYIKDNKNEVLTIINNYYNNMPSNEDFYAGLEKELLISQNLENDCEYCKAKSGEVCRTNTGNPTTNHSLRNSIINGITYENYDKFFNKYKLKMSYKKNMNSYEKLSDKLANKFAPIYKENNKLSIDEVKDLIIADYLMEDKINVNNIIELLDIITLIKDDETFMAIDKGEALIENIIDKDGLFDALNYLIKDMDNKFLLKNTVRPLKMEDYIITAAMISKYNELYKMAVKGEYYSDADSPDMWSGDSGPIAYYNNNSGEYMHFKTEEEMEEYAYWEQTMERD